MSSFESRKAIQAKYRAQCTLLGIRLKEAMLLQHGVRVDRIVAAGSAHKYVILSEGKNKHRSTFTFEVIDTAFIVTITLTENKQDTTYALTFSKGGRVHNVYRNMQACRANMSTCEE